MSASEPLMTTCVICCASPQLLLRLRLLWSLSGGRGRRQSVPLRFLCPRSVVSGQYSVVQCGRCAEFPRLSSLSCHRLSAAGVLHRLSLCPSVPGRLQTGLGQFRRKLLLCRLSDVLRIQHHPAGRNGCRLYPKSLRLPARAVCALSLLRHNATCLLFRAGTFILYTPNRVFANMK